MRKEVVMPRVSKIIYDPHLPVEEIVKLNEKTIP